MTPRWLRFVINEVKLDLKHGGFAKSSPIVIIAVTLFVLGLFLVVTVNLRKGITVAQGKVEMVVFLADDWLDTVDGVQSALERMPGVREVRFVPRDEALSRFRLDLGEKSGLLDAVESNPLPASLEVAIYDDYKSEQQLFKIATEAAALQGVEGIRYGKEWVGRLARLIVFSVMVDLFLGVLLGISTIVSVANTLRLALQQKRESIEVMRLVGASDGMIRGPVFLQGAMLGSLAAGIAALGLYGCYALLAGRVPELVFMSTPLLAAFVLAGGMLGGLGSLLALGRILSHPART